MMNTDNFSQKVRAGLAPTKGTKREVVFTAAKSLNDRASGALGQTRPTSHGCPAPGCTRRITTRYAFCPGHWYVLPKAIQALIWREYKLEPGSNGHFEAVRLAIEFLGKKGAPK